MPQVKPELESFVKIKVVGVGGSGCNAVSRMVQKRIRGVEFIGLNTDAQALHFAKIPNKILLGKNVTRGLGAGMNVELGRKAVEESREEIEEALKGSDMVFVTCGLGGGTGTPGIPVVAEIARNLNALTIGVVTKPFSFEGAQRMAIAEEGLKELKDKVDSLIVIPNDRVLSIIDEKTTLIEAFSKIDNILAQAVQAISEIITKPGLVNVDFADVRTIMKDSGLALMGIGKAKGEGRMVEAVKQAISSPLLELSIDGARGVLFMLSGGEDLTMKEVNDGAKIITQAVDPMAKIIFGAVIDEELRKGEVQATVIATGFNHRSEKNNFKQNSNSSQIKETPKPKEIILESDEDDEDRWDIPAFLRKGKV
jgi:cell division protein FtsZ